jgi:mRNA interferase MazF
MMTVKAGELWVAEITFTDGSASKKRPILILWIDGADVVLAAVTSSKPRTQTDVA